MNDIEYGSVEYLAFLVRLAKKADKYFNPGKYKWRLGAKHFHNLEAQADNYVLNHYEFSSPTLLGLPIEVDYANPDKVELWKNITNDL